jgi:hypothetical protein
MPKSRLLSFVTKELREILPPMVFFAVSFNLIVLTTDLILADYRAMLWELHGSNHGGAGCGKVGAGGECNALFAPL